MTLSLGIDAGGTYTDAVIISDSDERIIGYSKALTTYPDPLQGIKKALDGLDSKNLKNIKIVSVSTTLATNTILEGNGYPAGLIIVGDYDIQQELPTEHHVKIKGGHTYNGSEAQPLDIKSLKDFVLRVKDKVSSFAVSSLFSVRNPDHEEKVKEVIKELTGLPVVCAHELSQDLGAFDRAVTALLNAQLIPVTEKLIQNVESEIRSRDINAKIFMLKCDGSVTGIKKALEKPIESIFSGPSGSLMGASFLSKNETCAVIDVGGTSTDVSAIRASIPDISNSGAIVGGWKTRVKAIKMETSAMGGDSHIWVKEKNVHIGPRRVIPLCRASVLYPGFLDKLKLRSFPSKYLLGINFQPTSFFIRIGHETNDLSKDEIEIFEAIGEEPTSINDIFNRLKKYPSNKCIDFLLKKRLIQAVGFTLTDALHVLGDYTEMDMEASNVGADLLTSLAKRSDRYEFCSFVKKEFAKNIATSLTSFFLEDVPKEEIKKIFDISSPMKFKLEIPVVLIGGPVVAFLDELNEIIDSKIILPEFSNVGNAVGAVASKGIRRAEILIRPASMAAPDWEFLVFSEKGRVSFFDYREALDYATKLGESIITEYVEESELDVNNTHIDVKKDETFLEGLDTPIETRIVVFGMTERIKV